MDSLTKLKAKKPLVVVIDGLAASGGYIAAMAADHIVAQQSSLVGSIGVIFQYPNVSELLKTVGVKIEEVKSSPLKAAPNGYEPTSPEARAAIEAIVMDSYDWFKDMVRDRRKLDQAGLDKVADGRVFTGRQALALKLSMRSATSRPRSIGSPRRRTSIPRRRSATTGWRRGSATCRSCASRWCSLFDAVGLTALARRLEDWGTMQAIERLNLDGLLALWHPPMTN